MDKAASIFALTAKRAKLHLARIFIGVCRRLPAPCFIAIAELGQSLEFSLWLTRKFKKKVTIVATRDKLWQRIISSCGKDAQITVFEFGVAYGHATKWWLAHCKLLDQHYGFDTFTGLPRPWRHFPAGAFHANGKPPAISDSRLVWHIGRVEETFSGDILRSLPTRTNGKTKRVFIFDLDLFEPTRYVLEQVFPQLQDGDILYFDEAADWDERRALLETMDKYSIPLELLGATPIAMALQVVTPERPADSSV